MKGCKNSKQAGFSLVELMVVVGIIGILAALAVPKFATFTAKAKVSEGKSVVHNMYTLQMAFYSEQSNYQALAFDDTQANYDAVGYVKRPGTSNSQYFNDPAVAVGGAAGALGITISSFPRREICKGVTTAAGSSAQVNMNETGVMYYGAGIAAGGAAPTTAQQTLRMTCN